MNTVINKLNKLWKLTFNALFFADDGLIIAQNELELKNKIKVVQRCLEDLGLKLNSAKSEVIVFGGTEKTSICSMKCVSKIKYLGVIIEDKKNVFRQHIEKKIANAKKHRYWLPHILNGKILKAVIGKAFWKGKILPATLHGMDACSWNKAHIDQMDKIQNTVLKGLLNLPRRCPNAYVRAEIGISSALYRDIRLKLGLLVHIFQNTCYLKNDLIKQWNSALPWIKTCKSYLQKLNLEISEIETMTQKELKRRINALEALVWKADLCKLESLKYYVKYKDRIKEGSYLENSFEHTVIRLFQSGSILTNSKTGKNESEKKCPNCDAVETIDHLLIHCPFFNSLRNTCQVKLATIYDILHFSKQEQQLTRFITELFKQRFGENQ